MKISSIPLILIPLSILIGSCTTDQKQEQKMNLDKYPHVKITNGEVEMKVFLPDREKGLYRASRFDWSGVIGSLKYKGHEYFDYWKDTQDPLVHEDLPGPVEGYIEPGLGYSEAAVGEGFVRIGIGIIEKIEEEKFTFTKTYKITNFGEWTVDHGKDWISFTHVLTSGFGYAYRYKKTIRIKSQGFTIEHLLENTGEKLIETDQFNHNFFVIDQTQSGPAFNIQFPYELSSESDPKGLVKLDGNEISFLQKVEEGKSVFLELTGFGENSDDHQVTVVNEQTGAGISFSVDQPLYRMAFWTCKTTLCPENFIWISVQPGKQMEWTSAYTLFTKE